MRERQVSPLCRIKRHLRQIQHGENIGRTQLIAEAEAQDVKGGERPPALHSKQGLIPLFQPL